MPDSVPPAAAPEPEAGLGDRSGPTECRRCLTDEVGLNETGARHAPAYSVGCASAWAAILLVVQRVGDAEARKTMQLGRAAWWSGWASATIARAGYPPPKKPGTRGEKALQVTSVPLV